MKAVSLLTGPSTLLDHLGTLSSLLDIPLIVTDHEVYAQAKYFYPHLDVKQLDMQEISMEWLSTQWDVVFHSAKAWVAETKPLFDLLGYQAPRFVYCPHGNSDKVYTAHHTYDQDLYLIYGDRYFDLLHQNGRLQQIAHTIRTGNYRLPYYLAHKAFYDELCETHVFSHFIRPRPTLLYAPSWHSTEIPSSCLTETDRIIAQLKEEFNLIIKIHPKLIDSHPAHIFELMARHEHHPAVLFLIDFPPIYPLLARCDLYLGDFSSIGYDFLAFDKPLYFLNPLENTSTPRPFLYRCGMEIPAHKRECLREIILKSYDAALTDFRKIRQEVYTYAFGEEKSPMELKKEIWDYIKKPRVQRGLHQRYN